MRVPIVLAITAVLLCQPSYAAADDARRVLATDVVAYTCLTKATNETQNIKVKVTLTMPASTAVGSQLSIGWQGEYADGTSLKTPVTGLDEGTKLYAYVGISEYSGLTSATGVGELAATTPEAAIDLPTTQVSLLTTPNSAGTGTVRPGAINFGTRPTEPAIECEADNREDLTTYTLKVPTNGQGQDSQSPSPDDTEGTNDNTDDNTDDGDDTGEDSPEPTSTVTTTETPSGGVATGAGGDAGPDGRAVMLTGAVIALAAATGLRLRLSLPLRKPRPRRSRA